MASEWRRITLDQLGRIVTGKTPSSSRPDYFGGNIPFITPSDFDGRRLIGSTARYLTLAGADSIGSSRIPPDSVMVSCIGSDMGKAAVAALQSVTNQQINSIVVDSDNSALFVYYNLSRRKAEIRNIASGSAQPILNKTSFGQLEILLPPRLEQDAIVRVLGTLDDKIELNRQMNETLEGMARALFKSWFVDFDPVRAKSERRESKLSKQIADLFPAAMFESTRGPMPRGWDLTTWGTLVSLEYGKALSGYDNDESAYPVYGTNGRIGTHSKPLCPHPGVIIGRKGAYRGVHYSASPFFVIDTAFYIKPKKRLELRWVYYELLRRDINSMDSGSAIPSTSREDFYGLEVILPPVDVQEQYVRLLDPMWRKQEQNFRITRTLSALRDSLLPKLTSGELRIADAERIVGVHV